MRELEEGGWGGGGVRGERERSEGKEEREIFKREGGRRERSK